MNRNQNKIIDSVSASELLKALNTLQDMSSNQPELQISFCQEGKSSKTQKHNNGKTMKFELYMAQKSSKVTNKQQLTHRKSISPLQQHDSNRYGKLCDVKSRSHSPLTTKILKPETKINCNLKKQQKNQKDKENKKEETNIKNEIFYKASFQSKKILDMKGKRGAAYIPIQLRTEDYIKQKQNKIAKLQKQQQISKILSEKQCTFKPNIIKNYKRPKALVKEEKSLKLIEQESLRFESCEQNEFLCTPMNPRINRQAFQEYQDNQLETFIQKNSKECIESLASNKRYRNEKFNYLLDMIH